MYGDVLSLHSKVNVDYLALSLQMEDFRSSKQPIFNASCQETPTSRACKVPNTGEINPVMGISWETPNHTNHAWPCSQYTTQRSARGSPQVRQHGWGGHTQAPHRALCPVTSMAWNCSSTLSLSRSNRWGCTGKTSEERAKQKGTGPTISQIPKNSTVQWENLL